MWLTDLVLWLELLAAAALFLVAVCVRCACCRLSQSPTIPNAERIARSGAIRDR